MVCFDGETNFASAEAFSLSLFRFLFHHLNSETPRATKREWVFRARECRVSLFLPERLLFSLWFSVWNGVGCRRSSLCFAMLWLGKNQKEPQWCRLSRGH